MQNLHGFPQWLDRIMMPLIRAFYYAGVFCIILMMLLTVADVLLRFFLGKPILGSYEITEYLMAVLVFSAVPYTEALKGHVKVDLFYDRFRPRVKAVLACVTNFMGMSVLFLIAWANIKMARAKWGFGDITGCLPIPVFPEHIFIAVGSMFFFFVLLLYFLNAAAKVLKNES